MSDLAVPPTNPYFDLQDRLQGLIRSAAYFAYLPLDQILTERIADLAYQVDNVLLQLGFGLVITTASAKTMEGAGDYETLVELADLNLSIIHNPLLDPDHNALDMLHQAKLAVHGKSVQPTAPAVARPHDFFRVTGSQRRLDAPQGVVVHEVYVSGGVRLL